MWSVNGIAGAANPHQIRMVDVSTTSPARMLSSSYDLAKSYVDAKSYVIDSGYLDEIVWQMKVSSTPFDMNTFIREAAWVVLSAGFRESVVRRVFPSFAAALCQFDHSKIFSNFDQVRRSAISVFGNRRKIDAILQIVSYVNQIGLSQVRCEVSRDPREFLCSLPFIGPVTWSHLAKNIGLQVAKADRHLVRAAWSAGRPSVDALCTEISQLVGDPVGVVDVVLWRWSILHVTWCRTDCGYVFHGAVEPRMVPAARDRH